MRLPSNPAGLFAEWRFDAELAIYGSLLVILIVAGCVAVIRVRRWRHEDDEAPPVEDLLGNYQALVERGELAPEEFERIKTRLANQAATPAAPDTTDAPDMRIQAAREPRDAPSAPTDTRIQAPPSGP
ncbi:MAG: hypothetical protein L0Y71_20765 [Gemmataceae bacterium]|nr:hypothetical protein [Gemmataceae bacterium]